MPTVACPKCGASVKFEGSAGLCPVCASVVRAVKKSSSSGQAGQRPASSGQKPAPSTGRSSRSSAKAPLEPQELDFDESEQFAPNAEPVGKQPIDPLILYLSAGAGAVLLVFALYVVLSTILARPAKPLPAPAPPPAIIAQAPDEPPPVVEAPPPKPATAPAPIVIVKGPALPAWMSLKPTAPKPPAVPISDDSVGKAITRAVAFLKSKFQDDQLPDSAKDDASAGTDALVVYSLLHAGEAVNDSGLGISNPAIQRALNRLRTFDMSGGAATYCRALRASALAMYNREVDATQLAKDRKYLLDSEVSGAYDYNMPPKGSTIDKINWDNSNSQYGVLGIWASVQAGLSAPDKYWNDVEGHWLSCQDTDGSWDYKGPGGGSLTMTCAGITTLCVTAEQLELISSKGKRDAHPQMSQALSKALDWLGTGDHLLEFNGSYTGYSLYGVERAALATGFRWFGKHDWYRELGARELKDQQEDGSWGSPLETAFRVLFLSRGRQPIFVNKLRFDGDWNDRPRDAAKLTQYASIQLEKPFAWGVSDLSRNWWDWMESPFLFITTDAAPVFSDQDCQKLRSYTDAGGLIFVHNEYGSQEVDDFVNGVVRRAYPDYPFKPAAPDDLIYSTVFPMKVKPALKTVGNGTRTFLVYSPKDITQDWVRYKVKDTPLNPARELGLNLFVAAAGKNDYRNRLNSPYEEIPLADPIGTMPIFQVKYDGPWNPEHKAFERFSRWFEKQTSIRLDVQPKAILDLSAKQAPVAFLTGNRAVDFSKMDLHALHDYVDGGGTLVIDSTGGSRAFAASVRESLLPNAFPGVLPAAIPANDPINTGTSDCMDPLTKPKIRNFASLQLNAVAPSVQYAVVGKGTVIISDLDITTGLLDSGTYAVLGYTPAYCQSLVKNIILLALNRYHPQPEAK